MNVEEGIELFLNEQKRTTRESYRYVLADFARYIGTERPLNEVEETDLLRYMQNVKSRDYRPATISKYAKTVKTCLNWLDRTFEVFDTRRPPQRVIRVPRIDKSVDRDKAMTDDELSMILERHRYEPRTYALLLFAADTGARAGGMAGLKVDDIDLHEREAVVTEKGDKTRRVAFGSACATALTAWLLVKPPDSYPYVFRYTTGDKPMTASSLSQHIRRACVRAGVRSLGSHSLRHRKGYQFADSRIAPSVAATALGHADPTITLRHYYPHDWDRARQALDELAVNVETTPSKVIQLPKTKSS